MLSLDLPAGRFAYRFDGPADAPILILSNSLGTDHTMWDRQMPTFTRHFRVLRYDSRGHGASDVPPGPYTIEMLGQDALDLCDALDIRAAHFCGLSMGGMVGMWLASRAPERINRLALCNTSARMGPPQLWDARIGAVRHAGMESIIAVVLARWFTPTFFEREPEVVARMRQRLASTPAEGYIACCEAIRDMDMRTSLSRIRAKTLVVAGSLDAASPPADGVFLAETIPDGRYLEFLAAHIANVEVGQPFSDALVHFFLA
jgi:3-oxoadipate enol-lactonase